MKMTLIVYLKCNDAQIVASDRQEFDGSGVGEFVKKYYLPENREFVLALAGDSLRITTIVDKLYRDQSVTADTVGGRLNAITKEPLTTGNSDYVADGLLLVKDHNRFKFHSVWFSNSRGSIDPQYDIPLKCYGDGKDPSNVSCPKIRSYQSSMHCGMPALSCNHQRRGRASSQRR